LSSVNSYNVNANAFEPPPTPAVPRKSPPIGPDSEMVQEEIVQENVMKCANPTCNHSIGLVSHRRGLFGKRPYCSKEV